MKYSNTLAAVCVSGAVLVSSTPTRWPKNFPVDSPLAVRKLAQAPWVAHQLQNNVRDLSLEAEAELVARTITRPQIHNPTNLIGARGYDNIDIRGIWSTIKKDAGKAYHALGGAKGIVKDVGKVAATAIMLRDLESELAARGYDIDDIEVFQRDVDNEMMMEAREFDEELNTRDFEVEELD